MYYNDFRRNSGIPLVVKLGGLIVALYVTYLVLKLFAIVLTYVFAILKILLPIILVGFVVYFLLKFLFGYDLLARYRMHYYRK